MKKPDVWINIRPYGTAQLCWVTCTQDDIKTPGLVEIPQSVAKVIARKFAPKKRKRVRS